MRSKQNDGGGDGGRKEVRGKVCGGAGFGRRRPKGWTKKMMKRLSFEDFRFFVQFGRWGLM